MTVNGLVTVEFTCPTASAIFSMSSVLSTAYVTAGSGGYINNAYLTSFHGYTGNVWVAADGAPGPTAGAYTYVNLPPTLDASNPAPYCSGVVTVFGYHFQPGDSVRLTLLSGDRAKTLDTQPTTVDGSTDIPPGPGNTVKLSLFGYSGPVWVFADESYPGNLTTGAYLSRAC
jgi:hypothetical protein